MRRGARRARLLAALGGALASVLAAAPASAHGNASMGDFYAGLLQPVYHLDSLLVLLTVGLWAGQMHTAARRLTGPPFFAAATVVGGLAGVLGAQLAQPVWIERAGALLLGVLVAVRLAPPRPVVALLSVIFGLGHGLYGTLGELSTTGRPALYLLGLGVGPFLVTGWLVALADRVRAFWMQVGFRVAGSWIATIALLVSALGLAGVARR